MVSLVHDGDAEGKWEGEGEGEGRVEGVCGAREVEEDEDAEEHEEVATKEPAHKAAPAGIEAGRGAGAERRAACDETVAPCDEGTGDRGARPPRTDVTQGLGEEEEGGCGEDSGEEGEGSGWGGPLKGWQAPREDRLADDVAEQERPLRRRLGVRALKGAETPPPTSRSLVSPPISCPGRAPACAPVSAGNPSSAAPADTEALRPGEGEGHGEARSCGCTGATGGAPAQEEEDKDRLWGVWA